MIIDAILERKDALHYDSKTFYNTCLMYGDVGANITRAMDGGIEADVKDALKQYVQDNEYNPWLIDYIDRVNWIRGTEPAVEKAAAEEFEEACRLREEAWESRKAPDGKENVFAFECGVLLPPDHAEFDFYANNNPELPYGFYDENQGIFLMPELGNELNILKDYVKNGVENTYAIVSYQGIVDIGSDQHKNLLAGEFDTGDISYTYFKNADEIVWSGCKIDGKLVECFLEKEIKALVSQKDKIMVAILDDEYYAKHQSYPEEYSSEYAHEVYTFDTPEEFVQKWYGLPEGDWYWVFDKGEIVCSGAIDPGDIEIFEDYWDKSFDELEPVSSLDDQIDAANSLVKETNGGEQPDAKVRFEKTI